MVLPQSVVAIGPAPVRMEVAEVVAEVVAEGGVDLIEHHRDVVGMIALDDDPGALGERHLEV